MAALLALTGCGGNSNADVGETTETGEPTSGGTLHFAVGSDAGCVDPQQVTNNDSIYSSRQLVDSLTDQDPETGEIVPWLAEEWETNEDVTEFTFTLREGVTFSNGDPLDAAAVAANFDVATDLGARGSQTAGYLQHYTETEVHDDLTFTVKFDESNAQFLQASSTHNLGILHPDTVAQSPDDRCASVIGSGPFVLENYVPNDGISLTARDDYDWGSSVWDNQSAPHVDGIEFDIVPESGVRAGSLQSDQVDVIGGIAPQDEATLEAAGAQLLARANPGLPFGFRINHEHELLQDPDFRTAISLAIDRQEVVDAVFPDGTLPATSVLSSTTPGHVDLADELAFDPDQAQNILQEVGFEPNEEGILERDGQRAEIDVLWINNAATNSGAVELIQQQLAAVGIQVNLEEGIQADRATRIAEGQFDVDWVNVSRADGDILRTTFHSELANPSRIDDPTLDTLLEQQVSTLEPQERAEALADVQRAILSDSVFIPVVELTTIIAARDGVHGVRFDSGSRVHLNDVWLEDAA
jgi:peptide/nickel transport system substrate-binding protein